MENLHLWNPNRGTYFDQNVNIITWSNRFQIVLGKYNSIGRNCNFFLDANHRPDWITTSSTILGWVTPEIDQYLRDLGHPTCDGDIIIENDVWIGANSTILSGVKISNGAVVGTGSVVTKDVPPYAIVAGNPAKVVKYRFTEEQIEKLLKIQWWNWNEQKIQENSHLFWSNNLDEFLNKFYDQD